MRKGTRNHKPNYPVASNTTSTTIYIPSDEELDKVAENIPDITETVPNKTDKVKGVAKKKAAQKEEVTSIENKTEE